MVRQGFQMCLRGFDIVKVGCLMPFRMSFHRFSMLFSDFMALARLERPTRPLGLLPKLLRAAFFK